MGLDCMASRRAIDRLAPCTVQRISDEIGCSDMDRFPVKPLRVKMGPEYWALVDSTARRVERWPAWKTGEARKEEMNTPDCMCCGEYPAVDPYPLCEKCQVRKIFDGTNCTCETDPLRRCVVHATAKAQDAI